MFFNAQAARYVLLLGITNGLAGAFYWMSYSQLFTEFTGLGNRDSGLAIISIMTSTVNLAAPLIAGAIITVVGGMSGYNVVFRIAFAIGIITAAAYMWLPKPETSKGRARHKLTYRYVHIHKAIFWSLISECFKGIREGAFSFILTVMLYQMIQSEMLAGVNTFLASGASILSFLIISRRIKIANRLKYMETSVFCLFLFGIIVIFYINPVILMIFTVINAFFSGFITNSSFNTFLDSIQTFPDMNNFRPELFAEKEMYLAAGRCIGIFIIIFLDRISGGDFAWQAVSLIVLTLTQVGTLAACGHSMQLIKKASIARCGR
jgi:MFS family permease